MSSTKRKRRKTAKQLQLEATAKPATPSPHPSAPSLPPAAPLAPATPQLPESVAPPPAQLGRDGAPTSALNIPPELLQQLIPFLVQALPPQSSPSTLPPTSTSQRPSLAGLIILN